MAGKQDATTTSRIVAFAAIALGFLLAAGALLADTIGVSGGGEGVGWKQLIAAIVGVVIALAGVAFLAKPRGLTGAD